MGQGQQSGREGRAGDELTCEPQRALVIGCWIARLGAVWLGALLCSGCAVGHLWHLAVGQTKLLWEKQPIEEALQDPRLTPQQRDKIRLIQDVRQFALLHLGLHASATYTTFVFLDAPYVSYTLTAAPKDTLRSYVWWYPIVGSMPYRGFFHQDLALRAERRLQEQGYDTYVRGVRAYSTLGYFNDPILSSMLSYDDFDLIDTIIHEMLHQTVWIKSSVSFNESLASFVGEKGTLTYLTYRSGAEAPERQQYLDSLADITVFQEYMQDLVTRIEALYREPISREEKLQRREQFFAEAVRQYPTVFPRMKTTRYQHFFEHRTLNNALLMSFRVYNRDTSFFEQAFANHGGDLARMIAYFKTLRADQIPAKFHTR